MIFKMLLGVPVLAALAEMILRGCWDPIVSFGLATSGRKRRAGSDRYGGIALAAIDALRRRGPATGRSALELEIVGAAPLWLLTAVSGGAGIYSC
jgi:hypothetical protein